MSSGLYMGQSFVATVGPQSLWGILFPDPLRYWNPWIIKSTGKRNHQRTSGCDWKCLLVESGGFLRCREASEGGGKEAGWWGNFPACKPRGEEEKGGGLLEASETYFQIFVKLELPLRSLQKAFWGTRRPHMTFWRSSMGPPDVGSAPTLAKICGCWTHV